MPEFSDIVDLWEIIPCEYCGAPAGQPCVTRTTGQPARFSHWGRWIDMNETETTT